MGEKFERVEMSYEEFSETRRNGWLDIQQVVGEFSESSREAMGNEDKTKNWIMFNGVPFLYKGIDCPSANSAGYAYAELIVQELASQVGLEAAFYDLARYGDEYGIITRSVVEREDQDMLSLSSILGEDRDTGDVEELLANMEEALQQQGVIFEDIEQMKSEYVKRRIFDLFIMAQDTHTENISVLVEIDEKGRRRAKFAPVYDNESSLLLDSSEHQIDVMNRDGLRERVGGYIEHEIEPYLYYGDNWKEQLMFLAKLPGGKEFIEKCNSQLNVGNAIKMVEDKTRSEIPEPIRKFSNLVFSMRKLSIENEIQTAEIGDEYVEEIAEMSQEYDYKELRKLLRAVFDGITPEHEKKIKEIEESR